MYACVYCGFIYSKSLSINNQYSLELRFDKSETESKHNNTFYLFRAVLQLRHMLYSKRIDSVTISKRQTISIEARMRRNHVSC